MQFYGVILINPVYRGMRFLYDLSSLVEDHLLYNIPFKGFNIMWFIIFKTNSVFKSYIQELSPLSRLAVHFWFLPSN